MEDAIIIGSILVFLILIGISLQKLFSPTQTIKKPNNDWIGIEIMCPNCGAKIRLGEKDENQILIMEREKERNDRGREFICDVLLTKCRNQGCGQTIKYINARKEYNATH